MFDEDIGSTLRKACNIDDDEMHLSCAAQIVQKKYSFDGFFKPLCEQDVIPPSLMAFVRMILDGPNIKHQSEVAATTTRAVLSTSQLLMFNSVTCGQDVDSSHGCHNHDHETLLTLYVALKIHAVN